VTAAAHLAEYDAAGPAATRAHLALEHPVTSFAYAFEHQGAPMANWADLHRRIHEQFFGTEAPA
jgi:hypothetical protein